MNALNFTPDAARRFAVVAESPAGKDDHQSEKALAVIGWVATESCVWPVVLDPATTTGMTLKRWLDEHSSYRLITIRTGQVKVEVSGSVNAWTND